jgi:hypothetical protein
VQAIVDRFEENIAILETEDGHIRVPRSELPSQTREGDVLVARDKKWVLEPQATHERRKKIKKLAEKLWQD